MSLLVSLGFSKIQQTASVMLSCLVLWCCFLVVNVPLARARDYYSCPTWLYYSNVTGGCECGYQTASIHCNKLTMEAVMKSGYCITYSGQDGVFYGGICPIRYTVNNTNRLYSELPSVPALLEEAMCGPYNRKGFQCSECIDGYGPAVYSLDRTCVDCSKLSTGSAICLYILADLVPITLFFIAVMIFRFKITSGPILGYVMFCQGFSVAMEYDANIYSFLHSHSSPYIRTFVEVLMVIFEFWNLRFLKAFIPPFCISDKITGVHVLLLNSLPSIYPIVLVIMSFILIDLHGRNYKVIRILCKPFALVLRKAQTRAVTSDALIRAFATFILLSSTTNMFAMYAMLQSVHMWRNTDHSLYRTVLYFDANIDFLSRSHIVFLLIASVQCFFLVLIPSVVLSLYPSRFYRFLSRGINARKQQAIRTFAEALHSCFKDGLNGTLDYRAVAGVLIFGFPLLGVWCLVVQKTIASQYDIDICACYAFSFLSFFISYARPCKSTVTNMSLSFYSFLFGVCGLAHYLWMLNVSTGTESLKLAFLFIIVAAQLPVIFWAGYYLIHYLLKKAEYWLNLRYSR